MTFDISALGRIAREHGAVGDERRRWEFSEEPLKVAVICGATLQDMPDNGYGAGVAICLELRDHRGRVEGLLMPAYLRTAMFRLVSDLEKTLELRILGNWPAERPWTALKDSAPAWNEEQRTAYCAPFIGHNVMVVYLGLPHPTMTAGRDNPHNFKLWLLPDGVDLGPVAEQAQAAMSEGSAPF